MRAAPALPVRTASCPPRVVGHRRPTRVRSSRRTVRATAGTSGDKRAAETSDALYDKEDDDKQFIPVQQKPPLHVHVGAGKLAMGLVIPSLLESKVPLVVLQTTRAPFDKVRASAKRETHAFDESRLHLQVKHRNRAMNSLRLFFKDENAVEFATERSTLKHQAPENTFIISDDMQDVWVPLLMSATSISTAVGPALVDWLGTELLSKLPSIDDVDDESKLPKIFCCENDHGTVAELSALLKSKANVVPCVVDKVCSSLTIEGPEEEEEEEGRQKKLNRRRWTACVATEPFPGMVLPLTGVDKNDELLPFDVEKNVGGVFKTTGSIKTAQFLHRKKLSQVNGCHTSLAFMSLRDAPIKNFDGQFAVNSLADVKLRSLDSVSQQLADGCWTWAVAETLAVALNHDDETIADAIVGECKDEFECDNARYEYSARACLRDARDSLHRLSASAPEDTVGRVLNAGVLLRLEGRMQVTRDALRALVAKVDEADDGNDASIDVVAGKVASTIVRESGYGSLKEFSQAVDAVYAASASVANFVVNGQEEKEERNNAVVRLERWSSLGEGKDTKGEAATEK